MVVCKPRKSYIGSNGRGAVLGMCVLLAVTVLLAFGQTLRHEFVNFDDDEYFYANPHVQAGLTWRGVQWAFQTGYAGNWFPLTWLSIMLDVELFGPGPAGPHFTNMLLHAANTVLLFLLLRCLTGTHWRSAFVAALFGLHPLHVESVAWASERKDVLSGVFFMLTLLMYVRYARGSARDYWLALSFFALGLMSKPMLVTLPFVLLLLDYWPLGRMRWVKPIATQNIQLIKEKIPFFALTAASCVITYGVQHSGQAVESLTRLPLGMRIDNALLAYVGYMRKMFWPTGLAAFYPIRVGWSARAVMAALVVLFGITAAVIWRAKRAPWLVTGWFWYLGTLAPVIGLVQVGAQSMADRYTYIPLIGLFMMLCWSIPARVIERRVSRMIVFIGSGSVLAVCAVLCRVQVNYWKNTETLFQHALAVTRDNWLAHYNLGSYLWKAGRAHEAIRHYEQALEIEPDYAEAHNNLGVALTQEGQVQEAIGHYERALQIKPAYVEAHNNLGVALTQVGKLEEGIAHYEQALRIKPDYAQAAYNMGRSYVLLGRMQEAIEHWEYALHSRPDFAEAHYDLGVALVGAGRVEEAMEHWEQALRTKPDFAEAHYNLGKALADKGRATEAIKHYQKAVDLASDQGNTGMVEAVRTQLRPYEANSPRDEKP